MSLNRLTNDILKRLVVAEQRINELGKFHYGTVTAVSATTCDVRLFQSTDEGSVVLEDLDHADNYDPVIGDYVRLHDSGNGPMEDGLGGVVVEFAIRPPP